MSRWLLHYTPPAVLIRLLTTNCLLFYTCSTLLHLSGASSDPRLLLPAWISISSTLCVLYHVSQHKVEIRKETEVSVIVLGGVSWISVAMLLLQLHLTRENEPEVPLFVLAEKWWMRMGMGVGGRG